jgi:hypothetical protein
MKGHIRAGKGVILETCTRVLKNAAIPTRCKGVLGVDDQPMARRRHAFEQ